MISCLENNLPELEKKTAEKIVDKLGTDAINKIIADPHVLDELKLRKAVKDSLVDNLRAKPGDGPDYYWPK